MAIQPEYGVIVFSDTRVCPPCVMMEPNLNNEEVKEKLKTFTVWGPISTDGRNQKTFKGWKVDTIPTVILYREVFGIGNVEVKRRTGYMSKEDLLKFLETE